MCPYCTDREYDTEHSQKKAWREWVKTLALAGFEPRAHQMLNDYVMSLGCIALPRADKIEWLVGFYAECRNEDVNQNLWLLNT